MLVKEEIEMVEKKNNQPFGEERHFRAVFTPSMVVGKTATLLQFLFNG